MYVGQTGISTFQTQEIASKQVPLIEKMSLWKIEKMAESVENQISAKNHFLQ